MDKISEQQIENESNHILKQYVIDSVMTTYPLSELSDREFELLVYSLVKNEIDDGLFGDVKSIVLMKGVAERGRDCVLYDGESVCGVIQCKKYNSRISKPTIIKELIKFLLFSIQDETILPNIEKFRYYFYVSNDLSEPASSLIYDTKKEVNEEITNGNIEKYVTDVIDEYASFASFKSNKPIEAIADKLLKIDLAFSNSIDITKTLTKYPDVVRTFFNVKSVIDLESSEKIIRNALDDYGLRLLTDEELKELQKRISQTENEDRLICGFTDFFGYNVDFFNFLSEDEFKEIFNLIVQAKILLDKLEMDFLLECIHNLIRIKITVPLLYVKIHPFTAQLPNVYLFKRLSFLLLKTSMPKILIDKHYIQNDNKNNLIDSIVKELVEISDRIFKGDYSGLNGDDDLVKFKINLYKNHIHMGLNSIQEAKDLIQRELPVIRPILDEIEQELAKKYIRPKTVIIKDNTFFDDTDKLLKVLDINSKISFNKHKIQR